MDLAKNTERLLILSLVVDMNKDRKDVIDVKFTSIGRDYGVLVVVIY
jgi:hypothetical protein